MKIARLFLILGVLLLVSVTVAACGGDKATEAPPAVEEQSPATSEEEPQSPVEEAAPAEAEESTGPAMPPDVPVMPDYRDFQATTDFTNISYVVDSDIAEVVAWYQEQLPQYGWEMSRAPDSALGSIANLSRINADKDRLTISLQFNPVGLFTVVRTVVVRTP
jgi:hypothetical protein